MKKSLVILFVLLVNLIAKGDNEKEYGKFFIQNYTVDDHNAEAQTWAIIQDRSGVMYFGNNAGILEYDGVNWALIRTSNKSVVRSFDMDSTGTIYVGAVGDMGYLAPDSIGKMSYHSLVHLLDSADRQFKEVWMTMATEDKIYFSTIEGLYEYDLNYKSKENGSAFKVWRSKNKLMGVYNCCGKVITREPNVGLVRLEGNTLKLIEGTEPLANQTIWTIFPLDRGRLLISIVGTGIVIYDPSKPTDQMISQQGFEEANEFLKANRLYYGIELPNKRFAFSTLRKGMIIIDEDGGIESYINKFHGLATNDIACSYYNKGVLWLASHKAISSVDISSRITYWDEALGLKGITIAMYRFNDILFVGTTQGVFYMKENRFIEVPEIKNPSWEFVPLFNDQRLFVAATRGVYEIVFLPNGELRAKKAVNVPYTYRFCVSKYHENMALIGSAKGLFLVDIEDGFAVEKIESINEDIRDIEEDKEGNVWVATRYSGIIKIVNAFEANNKAREISKYNSEESGFKALNSIFLEQFKDELMFFTADGVYSYNEELDTFEVSDFTEKYLNEDNENIFYFYEYNPENYYLVYNERNNIASLHLKDDEKFELKTKVYKRLSNISVIRRIFVEQDKGTWIASTKGIYKFENNNSPKNNNVRTFIREVVLGTDSVISYGGNHKSSSYSDFPIFDYKSNSILIKFALPFFMEEKENQYSYKLERNGGKEDWSEWVIDPKKEYTNLYEGTYVFSVKSKNIYGDEAEVDTFKFEVLPPLHRTTIAYIVYLLAVGLLIWFFAVLYSRRLKAVNIRLENIILERTSEINMQKEEIQTQNENLEVVNAQLRKLSVAASKTDNAILIMDREGNFEWVNEGFQRIYGYNLRQFIEKFGSNILKSSNYENIEEVYKICIYGKHSVNFTTQMTSKGGRVIWTQTTLTPILNEEEEIESLIAIDTDITKLKDAEKFIEQQRDEIKKQRDLAILQKDEITDSIEYAHHIQSAILPSKALLEEVLKDYFVLNRPKAIVSGDFYWISKKGDNTIVAVADCTGHGVPGALMSTLGITFLNKIILEKGITDTAEILNRLRANIINALHQTGTAGEASDGMDIAVINIDAKNNSLQYSGAMSPLVIVRAIEGSAEHELIKIKHDVMPIAINHALNETYTSKNVSLQSGDSIYLYSDGFTDQFGGSLGKRFNFNNFKNLLLKIQNIPMDMQGKVLNVELEEWMGNYKQIDDILILGLKIK